MLHALSLELDVDDEIWQDVGLAESDADPPPWLADENVWAGIRYLWERDQCVEEEDRLQREWCHLQEWLLGEWQGIMKALVDHGRFSTCCSVIVHLGLTITCRGNQKCGCGGPVGTS